MKHTVSRKLIFKNECQECGEKNIKNGSNEKSKYKKNIFTDKISVSDLNIGNTPTFSTNIYTDKDSSVLTINNDVNITGGLNTDTAVINENLICKNIDVDGEIVGTDLNLIGDIISTNGTITDMLRCNSTECENIKCTSATINTIATNKIKIDTDLQCKIVNTEYINSKTVNTDCINSKKDLVVNFENGNCLVVPNIRYNVVVNDTGVVTPSEIRLNKFFIVTTTTILQGDSTCNGMQIVLYNKNNAPVVIRDPFRIVIDLLPLTSATVAYLAVINRFIIC